MLNIPFCNNSSNKSTIRPATNNWMMIKRQTPAPISLGSPYMPVITYTIACPTVMTIPNTEKIFNSIMENVKKGDYEKVFFSLHF